MLAVVETRMGILKAVKIQDDCSVIANCCKRLGLLSSIQTMGVSYTQHFSRSLMVFLPSHTQGCATQMSREMKA